MSTQANDKKLSAASDIDALLAAIFAASTSWRDKRFTLTGQTNYVHLLRDLYDEFSGITQPSTMEALRTSGTLGRVISVAVDHASQGMLPWVAVLAWDDILRVALNKVRDPALFAHQTQAMWTTVLRLTKEGSFLPVTSTPVTALCSCLYLLRTLLSMCPIEITVQRRQLPHPLKCVSTAARVYALRLLPAIVCNLAVCELNADILEYIKRAFQCTDTVVLHAAIAAVVDILMSGVTVEPQHAEVLFDLFMIPLSSAGTIKSDKLIHQVGVGFGCLIEMTQCGTTHCGSASKNVQWEFFGGATAMAASRTIGRLFRVARHPAEQEVVAVTVSHVLSQCASPETMEPALRSLLVHLIPTETDPKTQVSRIVTKAIEHWAAQMPSNAFRVALLTHLRQYLRMKTDYKAVLSTIIVCIKVVNNMLYSAREIDMMDDLFAVVEAYPSLLDLVGDTAAAFVEHSPFFLRRLLMDLTEQCQLYSLRRDKAITVSLATCVRTLQSCSTEILSLPGVTHGLITAMFQFENIGSSKKGTAYLETEYFFTFAKILLCYHSNDVSSFLFDKIATTTNTLLSTLVSTPQKSNMYLRASLAACELLLTRGDIKDSERSLCIGLLEGQLVGELPSKDINPTTFAKFKKAIYIIISGTQSSATGGTDEGSLCWLVSHALKDVEDNCSTSTVIFDFEESELFASVAVPFMRPTRRMVSTSQTEAKSSSLQQATILVAWGLHYFNGKNEDFCNAILTRVQRLLTNEQTAKSGNATIWNLMCLVYNVLRPFLRMDPEEGRHWAGLRVKLLNGWQALAQKVVCCSTYPLDLRILASKVVGGILYLRDGVDEYTTRVLRAEGDVIPAVLVLLETHVCHALACGTPAVTLPMAASFMTDLMRKNSIFDDPCAPLTIVLLLCYLRIVETMPAEVDRSIGEALIFSLMGPLQRPMSTLVYYLILILAGQLNTPEHEESLFDIMDVTVTHLLSYQPWHAFLGSDILNYIKYCVTVRRPCRGMEENPRRRTFLLGLARVIVTLVCSPRISQKQKGELAMVWLLCVKDSEDALPADLRLPIIQIAQLMDAATSAQSRLSIAALAHDALLLSQNSLASQVNDVQRILHAKGPNVMFKGKKSSGAGADGQRLPGDDAGNEVDEECSWGGGGKENILEDGRRKSVPLCSDIAAKTLMLDLLGVILSLTQNNNNTTDGNFVDEQTKRILQITVTAVPQVETTPELVGSAIELTHLVLEQYGQMTVPSGSSASQRTPLLLPLKSQLVANIKSLLQLSLMHTLEACELLTVFEQTNLADDTTMRRVLRGLFLFLLVLERLEEEGHAALMSDEEGPVVIAFSRTARLAESQGWTETYKAALEYLRSDSGQEALALTCNHLITDVALMNGCVPPNEFDSHADSSMQVVECTIGEVLEAVAQIVRHGQLGPTLRHAVGCLASIAMSVPDEDVCALPHIVANLGNVHQEIILNLAHCSLMSCDDFEVEKIMVDIITSCTFPLSVPIIEDVAFILFRDADRLPSTAQLVVLLSAALSKHLSYTIVCDCLRYLPVDYVHAASSIEVEATAYVAALDEETRYKIARSSPCAMVLMEHCGQKMCLSPSFGVREMLLLREAVVQTNDVLALANFMWPEGSKHNVSRAVLLSLIASEKDLYLIVKSERFICFSLAHYFEGGAVDAAGNPEQEQVNTCIELLLSLLEYAPQAEALRVLLQPFGKLLTKVIPTKYPNQLRLAIQSIGPENAIKLRKFMEQSTL